MSGKNQYPAVANWQSTNPLTGFQPTPYQTGSPLSGNINGAMASTNTIYSQIIDLSRMDNGGLEVTYIGTATGTFSIMGSNSGIYGYALTFNPALLQPSGSSDGYLVDLNQFPFKYIFLQYVNSSGTGILLGYFQFKDLN
jgi:hypothetical protein